MERSWIMNKVQTDWKAVRKLLQDKHLFTPMEHDCLILAESEWDTCYTSTLDVPKHKDGRPKCPALQSLSEDMLFYIECGWWGDVLLTMEKIDLVAGQK